MAQQYTEAEIADFLAQLDYFRGTLAPRQQRILDSLLESVASVEMAGGDGDVEGFMHHVENAKQWPVEPQRIARVIRRAGSSDT